MMIDAATRAAITRDDVWTVAKTIYGEARGEPWLGKIAVAWVIVNRHRAGKWFSRASLWATCRVPWQFSCWNEDDPNRAALEALSLDDPAMRECVAAALVVLTGHEHDPTAGATHYFAPAVVGPPTWAAGKTAVCSIGGHAFFDDID